MSSDAGSAGSRWGEKVKGAWKSVEGMGDTMRGGAMDFVDSATNSGPTRHPETDIGAQKTATGVNQMENANPAAGTTTNPGAAGVSGTSGATTTNPGATGVTGTSGTTTNPGAATAGTTSGATRY